MSEYIVKINEIDQVTHDVRRYETEKPVDLDFEPGQATEVAINKHHWLKKGRPFTFTSLPKHKYLEFVIKSYTDHNGVTDKLLELEAGDEFILNDVFGAITYQGEGVFIAGGAGVTPFIAIFRQLKEEGKTGNNKLIFANKTSKDIIYQEELEEQFGDNFVNILSEEETEEYDFGRIDKEYLQKQIDDFSQKFYVCGPPPMIEDIVDMLKELGAKENNIVIEES
jgi:hypothetical protein